MLPATTLVAGVPKSVRLTLVAVEADVEVAELLGPPPPQAAKQQTVMKSVAHRAAAAVIFSSMAYYRTGIVLAQTVVDWRLALKQLWIASQPFVTRPRQHALIVHALAHSTEY